MEFVSLLGPSGCGKSTLLRVIAGLEAATSGEVWIDDRSVDQIAPQDRQVAMVFQSYALYPHMTVRENLRIPLVMRELSSLERLPLIRHLMPSSRRKLKEIDAVAEQVATTLGLEQLLDRKPRQLSGGQKQRVALGRAITRQPKVFLMDEPLSNLDAQLRVEMRSELVQLRRRLGATILYVTHDQTEAMTMSDHVAVMFGGRIVQSDTPDRIYREPAHLSVAQFVGSPRINALPATALANDQIECLGVALPLRVSSGGGSALTLALRPEALSARRKKSFGWCGRVTHVDNLGSDLFLHVGIEALPAILTVRAAPGAWCAGDIGASVWIEPDLSCAHVFDSSGDRVALRAAPALKGVADG